MKGKKEKKRKSFSQKKENLLTFVGWTFINEHPSVQYLIV